MAGDSKVKIGLVPGPAFRFGGLEFESAIDFVLTDLEMYAKVVMESILPVQRTAIRMRLVPVCQIVPISRKPASRSAATCRSKIGDNGRSFAA